MLFTKRLHDELHAQEIQIKDIYVQVHAATARQVRNDYSLQEANDAERLCPRTSAMTANYFKWQLWVLKRMMSYRPNAKFIQDLIGDRDQLSNANASSGDQMDGLRRP